MWGIFTSHIDWAEPVKEGVFRTRQPYAKRILIELNHLHVRFLLFFLRGAVQQKNI